MQRSSIFTILREKLPVQKFITTEDTVTSALTSATQHLLETLAPEIRQEKEMKDIPDGKERHDVAFMRRQRDGLLKI